MTNIECTLYAIRTPLQYFLAVCTLSRRLRVRKLECLDDLTAEVNRIGAPPDYVEEMIDRLSLPGIYALYQFSEIWLVPFDADLFGLRPLTGILPATH